MMQITTAWHDDGDGPYMLSAYDEVTFDQWGGRPDFYVEEIGDSAIRELVIEIPDEAVTALFAVPTVEGTVQS